MLTYTIISYTKLHYLVTYIYWWKGITNGLDFKYLRSSEKALKTDEMLHILESVAAKSLQSCSTLWPHRWQPTRLPARPWDSPGKNTGVGFHFLLQCMKVKSESQVSQSCPILCDPMDCSLPGSSAHGIFQARVLEWRAIAFSMESVTWHIKHIWQTNMKNKENRKD